METSDFAVELRKIEKLVRHVSSERYRDTVGRLQMFFKMVFLKILQISQEKSGVGVSF